MINNPYVLFTRIGLTKTKSGKLYCDPLWAKDLKLHLEYISDFSLCCPVINNESISNLEEITEYNIKQIFSLKKDEGIISVIINLLPNLLRVVKACKSAKLVHSGGAGWAFPLSFYLLLLKPFFQFKWIIIIESSFWMLATDDKLTARNIITHYVHKIFLTLCVRKADVRIFTQTFYRQLFLKKNTDRTLIAPATWVNKNNLASFDKVQQRISGKEGAVLNLIFPARLEEYKGVFVLFKAIDILKTEAVRVNITIMGAGTLENECKTQAMKDFGTVNVSYCEQVKYGKEFYSKLVNFDLVLVPNLKEEQPRIIFDAFSQGIGVIASNTTGILDITSDGNNAIICDRGDAHDLAKAIAFAAANPDIITSMGKEGLEYASGKTHLQMHKDREEFIINVLNQ